MAPVESGGVGWSPSSTAERPGLFRPLKGAADDGPDVEEEVAGATLAASFALRSAAGFITRKGLLSGLAGLCRPPGVISRPTLTWPTGPRPLAAFAAGAAEAVAGRRTVAQAAIDSAANRRKVPVQPTPKTPCDVHRGRDVLADYGPQKPRWLNKNWLATRPRLPRPGSLTS